MRETASGGLVEVGPELRPTRPGAPHERRVSLSKYDNSYYNGTIVEKKLRLHTDCDINAE